MKKILLLAGFLAACALTASADESARKKKFKEEFSRIPRVEFPAYAAQVVKQTPADERAETVRVLVATISEMHPAAASSVVAAIAKAAPESSGTAADAAIRIVPASASAIQLAAQAPRVAGGIQPLHHKPDHEQGPGENGNPQGGVGLGPGPNKPGAVVVKPIPISDTLPNGKPRHFPPSPPRRPVDPPRPFHYNAPPNP